MTEPPGGSFMAASPFVRDHSGHHVTPSTTPSTTPIATSVAHGEGSSASARVPAFLAARWRAFAGQPRGTAVPGTTTLVLASAVVGLVATAVAAVSGRSTPQGLLYGVLGAGCLAVAVASLYHLCARLDVSRSGRLVVVAALLVNPAVLATLDRPQAAVLLAGTAATLAALARWTKATRTPSGGELAVYAGVPCAAAMFAGIEGWFLLVASAVWVAVVQLRRGNRLRSAVTRVGSLAAVPAFTWAWWVGREWLRYGDPLSVLPRLQPTFGGAAAQSLVCLLAAIPVVAVVSALVRGEARRTLTGSPELSELEGLDELDELVELSEVPTVSEVSTVSEGPDVPRMEVAS